MIKLGWPGMKLIMNKNNLSKMKMIVIAKDHNLMIQRAIANLQVILKSKMMILIVVEVNL